MENSREKVSPPYLNGGTPGALAALTETEAVIRIILFSLFSLGSAILLFRGAWTGILTVPLSVYSAHLSRLMFSGAKSLRRGDGSGADMIGRACRGNRILIWIGFVVSAAAMLFSTVGVRTRDSGYVLFAVLLIIGLTLLLILPMAFYYKNIERIMGGYISPETASGRPVSLSGIGRLSGISATFAVLMFLSAAVTNSNAVPSYRNALGNYSQLISLPLFLSAARFLLVNRCYKGFRASHASAAGNEDDAFAPSGYCGASTLCVLGSVFMGWSAMTNAGRILFYGVLRYSAATATCLEAAVSCVSCVLLALALIRRQERTRAVLTAAGAFLAAAIRMPSFFTGNVKLTWSASLPQNLSVCLITAFWILLTAACVLRLRGKTVPETFRKYLSAAAVLFSVLYFAGYVIFRAEYLSVYQAGTLYALIDGALYLISLLALVQTLRESSSSGDAAEPEKESVSDLGTETAQR